MIVVERKTVLDLRFIKRKIRMRLPWIAPEKKLPNRGGNDNILSEAIAIMYFLSFLSFLSKRER